MLIYIKTYFRQVDHLELTLLRMGFCAFSFPTLSLFKKRKIYHILKNINCVATDATDRRVAMAEWLARLTPNHKTVGSSPAKSQSALQKASPVGYGWRQWRLGSLSRK